MQEETKDKLEKQYGLNLQNQKPDALLISKMVGSIKCFDRDYPSYTAFIGIMDEIAATMPEPKRKKVLTDDDVKLINTLVDSKYPTLAVEKAIAIARTDDRLKEILVLDERYQKAICEVLGLDAEEYEEPEKIKQSDTRINEKALDMAKQSAKRATESAERSRQTFEYYGSSAPDRKANVAG